MDGKRWMYATEAARPSRLISIEAWSTVGGLVVGAILTSWLSQYGLLGIGIGALGGGVVGYILSIAVTWLVTFLRYPRKQLELRVAELEARPANAALRSTAPDLRPFVVRADAMLAQPVGHSAEVTQWIDDVYEVLFAWDMTIAHQFRPVELVPTAESLARRDAWLSSPAAKPALTSLLGMLNNPGTLPAPPSLGYDPQLVRLKKYLDKLLELVPQ